MVQSYFYWSSLRRHTPQRHTSRLSRILRRLLRYSFCSVQLVLKCFASTLSCRHATFPNRHSAFPPSSWRFPSLRIPPHYRVRCSPSTLSVPFHVSATCSVFKNICRGFLWVSATYLGEEVCAAYLGVPAMRSWGFFPEVHAKHSKGSLQCVWEVPAVRFWSLIAVDFEGPFIVSGGGMFSGVNHSVLGFLERISTCLGASLSDSCSVFWGFLRHG